MGADTLCVEIALRRDYPGNQLANITTVSFFEPYLTSDINYYINLVNLYRVQKDGLLSPYKNRQMYYFEKSTLLNCFFALS